MQIITVIVGSFCIIGFLWFLVVVVDPTLKAAQREQQKAQFDRYREAGGSGDFNTYLAMTMAMDHGGGDGCGHADGGGHGGDGGDGGGCH